MQTDDAYKTPKHMFLHVSYTSAFSTSSDGVLYPQKAFPAPRVTSAFAPRARRLPTSIAHPQQRLWNKMIIAVALSSSFSVMAVAKPSARVTRSAPKRHVAMSAAVRVTAKKEKGCVGDWCDESWSDNDGCVGDWCDEVFSDDGCVGDWCDEVFSDDGCVGDWCDESFVERR